MNLKECADFHVLITVFVNVRALDITCNKVSYRIKPNEYPLKHGLTCTKVDDVTALQILVGTTVQTGTGMMHGGTMLWRVRGEAWMKLGERR